MNRNRLAYAVAAFWVCCLGSPLRILAVAVDWPLLGFTQVGGANLTLPTSIVNAGDGSQRLFITEQRGRVQIIVSNAILPQPFLEITNRVITSGVEQGLLGLAFPPGYSTNGHFYIDYTRQPDGAVVISRFRLSSDPNIADPSSEEIILVIAKTYNNHNGGQLAFGPDGYLYIGVGDGGSEGDPQLNGQKKTTLLGKLLRIDVEGGVTPYAVPANNPFVGDTNYLPEIWALGLRNPWRFSFDRLTGDLFIGDVGQYAYEEIDFQPAGSSGGQNYGWRIMEAATNYSVPVGFTNFSALTLPIVWYSHNGLPSDGSASVTGGYVYRGPSEPRMDGLYFYGDYVNGLMWALKFDGTNWLKFSLPMPTGPFKYSLSTFGEDEQGRLYTTDYARGKIYQISETHQVWAPAFAPSNGIVNSNYVTVSCASPNAAIHYTTNGIDPTESDPVVPVSGLLQVSNGATNKARAFRADLNPSQITTAVFNFKVGTPAFNPPAGSVTIGTRVALSTVTPNATIYYTTNGASPSTNSLVYTGPVTVNGNTTYRAFATAAGYADSAVAVASYSITPAATPLFDPVNVLLTNTTYVSISCTTPGVSIRYTVDGTPPTTNSSLYVSPVSIATPTTLRAAAYRDDLAPSAIQTAFYGFYLSENTVVTTFAGSRVAGFSNAVGALAQFWTPQAICFDRSGRLLVGDRGNHLIRLVLPSSEVQTFAGSGVAGKSDGPAASAQFEDAAGVCCDHLGNVFVSEGGCGEWRIRKVDTNGIVSTLRTQGSSCHAIGQVEIDQAGNLYAGYGGDFDRIAPSALLTTLANYGGFNGYVGIGIDASTNVYPVEAGQIWKFAIDGSQTLVAGNPSATGFSDGPAGLSLFAGLQDAVVDNAGNIVVGDLTRVRRITPAGSVTTVAGTSVSGYSNGRGRVTQFGSATGLCVDTNGNIYVTDSANNCIRKISPDTANIGIADDWQLAHFGYIGIDPNDDPDHDGMSNFAEFWAGTDPLDSSSCLAISTTSLVSGGHIQIGWQTVAGKTYMVQYSADLLIWNNLGSSIQGDGALASLTDSSSLTQSAQRYYRIKVTAF